MASTAIVNSDGEYFLDSVLYISDEDVSKFTIMAVNNDCTVRIEFVLTYISDVVPGTFPIVNTSMPGLNQATVSYTSFDSSGVVVSQSILDNGMVIVTGGAISFTIDINGSSQDGTNITFVTAHDFNG
ncbi:hypothetical protein [Nonlabens sp. Asnod2-A12]|uniref:hypothetical protein n=1 Tax=Nonlabens sp. Asnod2-A12 TaxID=3160578 RepID=UPI00386323FD